MAHSSSLPFPNDHSSTRYHSRALGPCGGSGQSCADRDQRAVWTSAPYEMAVRARSVVHTRGMTDRCWGVSAFATRSRRASQVAQQHCECKRAVAQAEQQVTRAQVRTTPGHESPDS